ncbi:Eco57I restriction-modification methylase domain-containing protein [Myroides marinus]|uniref:Eco57I restriction-modification methylase domain-containing protein n=1 Tax=Myroides marinus TaxID=703342 RepID=UPI002576F009|nr:Eco57I restriction-modification methylase domain-containing protein [Myroides marinus]MDM1379911.1 Eco57I restriction-modification methylase domain-containing protein [Myroides marinus]MDM1387140.1 Eco57I restriction-modification methylase domain-containing protein [Myroides marinus]MDM1394353.1 Eco57I restriction-modification methylase domain-containing protein [Myroides marinus]
MKTAELKKILQSPYSRKSWISTLQFLSGKRDLVTINLSPIEIDINTKEANKIVDQFHQIGSVKTTDNIVLPIFEIILNNDIKIEHNRVAVNEFIKKHIIKDAIKGALVTFSYANVETEDELLKFNANSLSKSEWRFSFISKNAANDFFAEAEGKETNPKKFTYIFGNNEAHRTAIECLYNLEQSRFRLDDFFEAFNVEPVSKKFFDEYKQIYNDLAGYIYGEGEFKKIFKVNSLNEDQTKKEIRSFVGRLMGRIVFLYFLQKKNWLGASNTDFTDGSTSFLSDIFNNDTENQSDFYQKYLCPIFFEALNTNRGLSEEFVLINGNTVCIPFLNGGLFEEEQEPKGHRNIKFRKSDFNRIFEFFNSYNFTVYENSPEEHTIAVDPEMLGHIFENLIDYNKDTGTFYTPKEIVQYMTQESLIEYLFTNTSIKWENLELLVKNQFADNISNSELNVIDEFLDNVKICDPAIGSGAFPVGMLQEIFNLKALINYRFKDVEWKPADIKQNIIQNSIYGVDIDSGAVEISRLRFWLSLVIDEGLPKPLPNLDFKIVVGNSLSSKFGLDDNISSIFKDFNKKLVKKEIQDPEILELIGNKKLDLELYKNILEQFVTESNHDKKIAFKKLVQAIKESFRSSLNKNKNDKLSTARGTLYNLEQKDIFGNIKGSKKEIVAAKKSLKDLENKMKDFENDEVHKDAIEWRFEFPHLLDAEANFIGFDIVIGNPPYIKEYTNKDAFDGFRKSKYYQGKMDIWYAFTCVAIDLLKENGVQSFIAQNNWITSAGASIVRNKVLKETEFKLFTDFWNYKVFKTAGIQTMIYLLKKKMPSNQYQVKYSVLKDSNIKESELANFLDFNKPFTYAEKFIIEFNNEEFIDGNIVFNHPNIQNILNKILNNDFEKLKNYEVAQGIVFPQDRLNKKNAEKLGDSFKVNEGIFQLNSDELDQLNLALNEYELIKPIYSTKQLHKYYGDSNNLEYIIYTKSSINKEINNFPNIKNHLNKYKDIITSDNKPYGLHRARNEEFFKGEKIISLRKNNEPCFTYTDFDCYVTQTFYSIKSDRFDLKYLTVLLNSKLIKFWLRYKGKMQGDNYQLDKEPLVEIPIIQPKYEINKFTVLLDYILYLKNPKSKPIFEHTSNDRIVNHIENILDMMIYELYFKQHMIENQITVLENINPIRIDSILDYKEKSTIIKYFYTWYQEPDNIVRQRQILIKTRSLNLISQINKFV